MERIGIRDLRQHASRWIDKVRAGKSIEVTDRGELVAVLVPAQRHLRARDRLIADGKLTPATNSGGLRDLPAAGKLQPGSPTAADILDELREDRL